MKAFPGEPYIHLVNRLGDDVAPIQLECVQFDEAEKQGDLRFAAMDSLVRDLREYLEKGWEGSSGRHFATIQAYVAWLGRLEGSSRNLKPNADLHRLGESVWNALEEMQPPIAWVPAAVSDEYVSGAFAIGWPEGT